MPEALSVDLRKTCITDVAKLVLDWRLPPKEKTNAQEYNCLPENIDQFLNEKHKI